MLHGKGCMAWQRVCAPWHAASMFIYKNTMNTLLLIVLVAQLLALVCYAEQRSQRVLSTTQARRGPKSKNTTRRQRKAMEEQNANAVKATTPAQQYLKNKQQEAEAANEQKLLEEEHARLRRLKSISRATAAGIGAKKFGVDENALEGERATGEETKDPREEEKSSAEEGKEETVDRAGDKPVDEEIYSPGRLGTAGQLGSGSFGKVFTSHALVLSRDAGIALLPGAVPQFIDFSDEISRLISQAGPSAYWTALSFADDLVQGPFVPPQLREICNRVLSSIREVDPLSTIAIEDASGTEERVVLDDGSTESSFEASDDSQSIWSLKRTGGFHDGDDEDNTRVLGSGPSVRRTVSDSHLDPSRIVAPRSLTNTALISNVDNDLIPNFGANTPETILKRMEEGRFPVVPARFCTTELCTEVVTHAGYSLVVTLLLTALIHIAWHAIEENQLVNAESFENLEKILYEFIGSAVVYVIGALGATLVNNRDILRRLRE